MEVDAFGGDGHPWGVDEVHDPDLTAAIKEATPVIGLAVASDHNWNAGFLSDNTIVFHDEHGLMIGFQLDPRYSALLVAVLLKRIHPQLFLEVSKEAGLGQGGQHGEGEVVLVPLEGNNPIPPSDEVKDWGESQGT